MCSNLFYGYKIELVLKLKESSSVSKVYIIQCALYGFL